MPLAPEAPPSAEALLERSCRQDQEALDQLMRIWIRRLFALAFRILKDRQQAEEVVQDAFFKIWNKACSYNSELGKASSWMFSVVHRLSIDRLRSNRVRGSEHTVSTAEPERFQAPGGDGDVEEDLWRRRGVLRALETLSQSHREVIELAYYEGLTREEMAQRLSVPVGTVKTRLRDALIRLRRDFAAIAEAPNPNAPAGRSSHEGGIHG